jgi:hypothetical protein
MTTTTTTKAVMIDDDGDDDDEPTKNKAMNSVSLSLLLLNVQLNAIICSNGA